MDNHKSLEYVKEFEQEIAEAPNSIAAEMKIRSFLMDILQDCPMSVLIEIATCVLNIRKAELKRAGESN